MKTFFLATALCISSVTVSAALNPDSVYMPNIHTVLLYQQGKQLSMPVINLSMNDRLELHFDDLDGRYKNYYYTFQLCNYDWTPAPLMPMQYTKGFTQNKINDYKFSSVALTRYTHYSAVIPQGNSYPTKAGNYILRVYLNGDTSQIAFTKRFMVLNTKASITGKVMQPFTPQIFRTHQKIQFNVDLSEISGLNATQQVKVVLMQNYRWDNAIMDLKPSFIRGNNLEYSTESTNVFPAGKEWRWLDLRDFHLQTDRVASADYNRTSTNIYVKTDAPMESEPYIFYPDLNGLSVIDGVRGINPNFEGDYATVYFSYLDREGYANRSDIYLFGQLTNYEFTDSLKLRYNEEKGLYETHMLLKQGYYSYTYLSRDYRPPFATKEMDGNYYETENAYTILVYYRPFGAQSDELAGIALVNSRSGRPGFSF
ncbi:MAG: DUF5103 domain-containing protein [Chitinophagaceae bacterium]|nr:DUF5103 domain-containing protein [Chitinophagaceae bacterium]